MEISFVQARANLADAINRVAYGGERVIVRRHNKAVAALVSMDDLRLLEELEDRADLKAAQRARKEKGGVPLERVKSRMGIK